MGAQEVVVSRTIAAAPEAIWQVITDIGRAPDFFRSVSAVEVLGSGGYAPGFRWRETLTVFGRSETRELTVVEVDPNRRTVLESEAAGVRYRISCELTRSGDHYESAPRTLVVSRFVADQLATAPHILWRVLGSLGAKATEEVLAQDLADLASVVERADAEDMIVIHRLFNRELTAGPDLVTGVPGGDLHRAGIVADHLEIVLNTLVDHHHGEDLLIWPLLAARTTIPEDVHDRVSDQHDAIHDRVGRARDLLRRWREQADSGIRDELAGLITELADILRDHLEDEENRILPLVEQHLTHAEYLALVEHGHESLPKDKAALIVQLVLEGANKRERALVLERLPRSQQLMIRTVGARQYRRYVRRLREAG
ncbi:SRPBCC family protein [Ammonicoccus fulvus]|uniref:SRPBCC family protein n=1 Tax=Ammonicoccus fulvus TaxID=3138240 RepID=A0ABZ3FST6_9ACTN